MAPHIIGPKLTWTVLHKHYEKILATQVKVISLSLLVFHVVGKLQVRGKTFFASLKAAGSLLLIRS